jgi:drug/metabolite transporter (DMT)-like permease
MLVLVTLVWGLSFPWTKSWQVAARDCPGGELLSTVTLIGLRMLLAAAVLALWRPRLFRDPAWHEHAGGLLLGAVFFAGFALQTWGLAYTTPTLSAFFTSLCSGWVPLLAFVFLGVRVRPLTLLGLAVALAGTGVLVEGGWKLGFGEGLTLAASVLFAVQLLVLDRLGRRMNPGNLTAGFFVISGVAGLLTATLLAATGPGLGAWSAWCASMLSNGAVLQSLACQVALPTVLGFLWMHTYHPQVSASRAALIYLLEPVFTAVFSVWWGYDDVTPALAQGGALILLGNLLVEMPRWLYGKK